MTDTRTVLGLPVVSQSLKFNDWTISYEKSNILKTMCHLSSEKCCDKNEADLYTYKPSLQLPYIPKIVFHNNKLVLQHKDGALMEFKAIDALARHNMEPLDWTLTSTYQGTLNDKFHIEATEQTLSERNPMQGENIIYYNNLPLYGDKLYDHGISAMSVKICVMPSGFFVLLRHFLRINEVRISMYDTLFYCENDNDYIWKEFVHREATCTALQSSKKFYTNTDELQNHLPVKTKELHKLYFK